MNEVLFLQGRLGTSLGTPDFGVFLTIPSFLWSLVLSRSGTRLAIRIQRFIILDIKFRFTYGESNLH